LSTEKDRIVDNLWTFGYNCRSNLTACKEHHVGIVLATEFWCFIQISETDLSKSVLTCFEVADEVWATDKLDS